MKSIIIFFIISLLLLSCSKQTINLDAKVQKELLNIDYLCQTTNPVAALLLINKKIENKIINGNFILPNYAYYAIAQIISNHYSITELEKELSNTNNINILMARSILSLFENDRKNAFINAYNAYKLNTNRIDIIKQILEVGIDYNNDLDKKIKPLIEKYNFESTNILSKFLLNYKYNINKQKNIDNIKIVNKFQKKYPKYKNICDIGKLWFYLYSNKKINYNNKKNITKKTFKLFKSLYKNGYKDTWFGAMFGCDALKEKKYELAIKCFEMSIELSKKYEKRFYNDKLLVFYGIALYKNEKIANAQMALKKAVDFNPTNEYAISFLKKLD